MENQIEKKMESGNWCLVVYKGYGCPKLGVRIWGSPEYGLEYFGVYILPNGNSNRFLGLESLMGMDP